MKSSGRSTRRRVFLGGSEAAADRSQRSASRSRLMICMIHTYGTDKTADAALKKGSAELLILSLLEERARHGYEIAKLIEARSDGVLTFHAASLYPLLYRMEGRRLIHGRWVEKAGERRKRHYSITPAGRARSPSAEPAGTRSSPRWRGRGVAPCVTGARSSAQELRGAPPLSDQAVEELAQHVEETWRAALTEGSARGRDGAGASGAGRPAPPSAARE